MKGRLLTIIFRASIMLVSTSVLAQGITNPAAGGSGNATIDKVWNKYLETTLTNALNGQSNDNSYLSKTCKRTTPLTQSLDFITGLVDRHQLKKEMQFKHNEALLARMTSMYMFEKNMEMEKLKMINDVYLAQQQLALSYQYPYSMGGGSGTANSQWQSHINNNAGGYNYNNLI